jgi:hypothetical protein
MGAIGVTVAWVVTGSEVQPLSVAVTVYVPEFAGVAPVKEGDCILDANEGPDHANVDPLVVDVDVKFNVAPWHTGPLLPAVTTGTGFTSIVVVSLVVHPFKLAVII